MVPKSLLAGGKPLQQAKWDENIQASRWQVRGQLEGRRTGGYQVRKDCLWPAGPDPLSSGLRDTEGSIACQWGLLCGEGREEDMVPFCRTPPPFHRPPPSCPLTILSRTHPPSRAGDGTQGLTHTRQVC